MKFSIILIILLFRSSFIYSKTICHKYSNDCEYYSCIEKVRHCGQDGYPINFGKKYCIRFEQKNRLFTYNGKEWVDKVRACLIRKIEIVPLSNKCDSFKKKAFRQHVPCYVQSGYCQLSLRDKLAVIKVVKKEILNTSILQDIISILQQCKY